MIKGNPCHLPAEHKSNKVQYNHAQEMECSLQYI